MSPPNLIRTRPVENILFQFYFDLSIGRNSEQFQESIRFPKILSNRHFFVNFKLSRNLSYSASPLLIIKHVCQISVHNH